jgi:hypothetical protein
VPQHQKFAADYRSTAPLQAKLKTSRTDLLTGKWQQACSYPMPQKYRPQINLDHPAETRQTNAKLNSADYLAVELFR